MPEPNPNSPNLSPAEKKAQQFANSSALALELPFTLVGAIAVSVAIGYFADRWLHTRPILMIVFGALGFAGGLREVLRRLPVS
jgi:F0F1-type ATP synthase assembly protein I